MVKKSGIIEAMLPLKYTEYNYTRTYAFQSFDLSGT